MGSSVDISGPSLTGPQAGSSLSSPHDVFSFKSSYDSDDGGSVKPRKWRTSNCRFPFTSEDEESILISDSIESYHSDDEAEASGSSKDSCVPTEVEVAGDDNLSPAADNEMCCDGFDQAVFVKCFKSVTETQKA